MGCLCFKMVRKAKQQKNPNRSNHTKQTNNSPEGNFLQKVFRRSNSKKSNKNSTNNMDNNINNMASRRTLQMEDTSVSSSTEENSNKQHERTSPSYERTAAHKNYPMIPNISIERLLQAANTTTMSLSEIKNKSRFVPSDDYRNVYSNQENLQILEHGGCLFSFVCTSHDLHPYDAKLVDSIINLSAFDDETKENYVPYFDYESYQNRQRKEERNITSSPQQDQDEHIDNDNRSSPNDQQETKHPKYTFLITRCSYLLAGVDLEQLTSNSSILSTLNYQRECQPEGTKIWDDYDKMEPNNFRMTKPIIPYIYSFTIQFRVSSIDDPKILQELSNQLGIRFDSGILFERTKRSVPPKEDATKKTKSVLLYTDYGQGITLVTHVTIVLQNGLPEVIERIIGSIGQWGLGETAETAWRTRKYLQKTMPYEFSEPAYFLDAASEEVRSEKSTPSHESEQQGKTTDESDDDDFASFFDAMDSSGHSLNAIDRRRTIFF